MMEISHLYSYFYDVGINEEIIYYEMKNLEICEKFYFIFFDKIEVFEILK